MVFILSIILSLSFANDNAESSNNFIVTHDAILRAGTHVTILEKFTDEHGQEWVRLGIDDQNYVEQDSSSDLWIRAEDLELLALVEDIAARMTYCYRYVKKYLLAKGFVDEYLPGASAYMAATILPKYGFLKTSRVPTKAIKYDVCVYKGGPSGHGHIEVLDPKGWYYGYGYKKNPIQNRIFISCFYKKLN